MLEANITNIQHFNVHDGPGIRTVVFYQGCPLRCKWCQNPETISKKKRVMQDMRLCIGCGACLENCPNAAISYQEGTLHTDTERCALCGRCEDDCCMKARALSSRRKTIDEVYTEVMKDETVYRKSGGGITISGGEPLLHMEFNRELFRRLKAAGIGTAVETAGYVPWKHLLDIAEDTDTFLFDFKLYDCDKHKFWTGVENSRIKENLIRLSEIHPNIVVRIPLIPMVNDTEEEFTAMTKFVSTLKRINSVHVLPFHQFGAGKYDLLGEPYELGSLKEDNDARIQECIAIAKGYGLKVNLGGTGFAEDKKIENRCEMGKEILLEMKHIGKSFGGTH